MYKALRQAGLQTALFPRENALELTAGAGIIIVDDFHYKESPVYVLTKGAMIVQLWHGVGFKKIGFLEARSSVGLTEERKQYLNHMYSGYDVVISTSEFYTKNLFETSFEAKKIIETGYPRNDVFFRPVNKYDLLESDINLFGKIKRLKKDYKVAVYAPTFRDDGSDPLQHKALDFRALSAFLKKLNVFLILKMHHNSLLYGGFIFDNIYYCHNDHDIYPIMPYVDFMITDYSSIYMDYLLLDKPVIFFPYDEEEYKSKQRELQFDYDSMTPGIKCHSQKELMDAIHDLVVNDKDGYSEKRKELQNLAFKYKDGNASERIVDYLRQNV